MLWTAILVSLNPIETVEIRCLSMVWPDDYDLEHGDTSAVAISHTHLSSMFNTALSKCIAMTAWGLFSKTWRHAQSRGATTEYG